MNFLFVGLGNPGPEYENTRHNIGFSILDHLAKKKELAFSPKRYASIAEFKNRGKTYFLAKPQTFMNLSGKAVRYWLKELKIPIERLLVITDDLSLPVGKIRLRKKGSSGGHNGLQNIEELMNTNQYARLRFGVGNDFPLGNQINYVLSQFSEEEKNKLEKPIDLACEAILAFPIQGIDQIMNRFNTKK
jgi:peptidyl-tRNA hydrolase, PTH1 family